MKFYITQWAITRGIEESEGYLTKDGRYFRGELHGYPIFVSTKNAHRNSHEARLRYREMLRASVASAEAKAKKLRAIASDLDREIESYGRAVAAMRGVRR